MADINNADFTPDVTPGEHAPARGNYKPLHPFMMWCQKVLPLVYDESLSYYEVLCKVVDYLNKTMEDVGILESDVSNIYAAYDGLVETMDDNVQTILTAYENLQTYVNTYFDNLDVQEEINNKLDVMATDGTLSALVSPFIPAQVTAWLNAHVDPSTGYVIDNTLTISGAAADAKVTGDEIRDLNSDLKEIIIENNVAVDAYQIATGWKLNENGYAISDANYKLLKFAVTSGDNIFVLSDNNDIIMQFQGAAGVPSTGTQTIIGDILTGGYTGNITIPENARYLIISTSTTDTVTGVYRLIANINEIIAENLSGIYNEQITNNTFVIPVVWESGLWDDQNKGAGRANTRRLRSKTYLHSPTGNLIFTNPNNLNWFILEFDNKLNYKKSSGSWSVATNYALEYPYFKIVIRKPNDTDIIISDTDNFSLAITTKKDYDFTFFKLEPDSVSDGYYLDSNGLAKPSTSGTKIFKYNVTGLKNISLISNTIYQFQIASFIPSTGINTNLVGEVITTPMIDKIDVPETANWLCVNVLANDNYSGVYALEKSVAINATMNPSALFSIERYIGHRGGGKTAPENTLPCFAQGLENGFKIFEFDIQFTYDNIPVILHDAIINNVARNSDGSQIADTTYINDITYEQALTYDFGVRLGQTYAGTKILSFDELLLWLKKNNCGGEVDISGTENFTDERATILYNIAKKRGMLSDVFFTANQTRLQQILMNGTNVCVCVSNIGTSENAVTTAAQLKLKSIFTLCSTQYPYLTEEQINLVHNNGMKAKAFTIDTIDGLNTVNSYGIDYIILHNLYPNELNI